MLFILYNVFFFIVSAALILGGFLNFKLFLSLPLVLEVLIVIGFVSPVMTLYDTIKNFVSLGTLLSEGKDEDNL